MDSSNFVSRADARRRGIALNDLIGPAHTRLFFDCYVSAGTPVTPALLARAASVCTAPASAASQHTATRLLGGIVLDSDDVHLATVVDKRSTTSSAAVTPPRASLSSLLTRTAPQALCWREKQRGPYVLRSIRHTRVGCVC